MDGFVPQYYGVKGPGRHSTAQYLHRQSHIPAKPESLIDNSVSIIKYPSESNTSSTQYLLIIGYNTRRNTRTGQRGTVLHCTAGHR